MPRDPPLRRVATGPRWANPGIAVQGFPRLNVMRTYPDPLPTKGAMLIALPMKIKGGTGGPARIIAILP
jgi:hypothetical protein